MVVLGITPVVNTFCFVSFSNQSSTSSTSKLLPKIQPHAQGQRWTLDMTWTHELLIGTYRLWNNPYPIEKDFIPPKKTSTKNNILLMKIIPKWNWLGCSSPKKHLPQRLYNPVTSWQYAKVHGKRTSQRPFPYFQWISHEWWPRDCWRPQSGFCPKKKKVQ